MSGLPASDKDWRAQCQAKCKSSFGLPPKIDLNQLARNNGSVAGVFPIVRLSRLVQDLPAQHHIRELADIEQDATGAVWYEFKGSSQQGRRPRVWLKVQAVVTLICQRCLGVMPFVIDETVEFELFPNEAKANASDSVDEADPDAPEPLVADGPIDLLGLVEDQLILAIPYVPKHETCEPAKTSAGDPVEQVKRESPFKVLEGLKRDSK
ncbi:YceD family protein [Orrella daihaiensis]|uniref:Large ribosomal RNA subunit accumulation protein YceD n=1 Tax=Orrella daihaiensis TaxID=2782176 RepID=A0ABY4AJM3_9BURK|nr:YceD family protein [Orrella daihaiensis]UOD49595.1 DUF177 domain-containing protein [Orrella daihaiensis]